MRRGRHEAAPSCHAFHGSPLPRWRPDKPARFNSPISAPTRARRAEREHRGAPVAEPLGVFEGLVEPVFGACGRPSSTVARPSFAHGARHQLKPLAASSALRASNSRPSSELPSAKRSSPVSVKACDSPRWLLFSGGNRGFRPRARVPSRSRLGRWRRIRAAGVASQPASIIQLAEELETLT